MSRFVDSLPSLQRAHIPLAVTLCQKMAGYTRWLVDSVVPDHHCFVPSAHRIFEPIDYCRVRVWIPERVRSTYMTHNALQRLLIRPIDGSLLQAQLSWEAQYPSSSHGVF